MSEQTRLDSREYRAWNSYRALTRLLEGALDRRLQRDVGVALSDFQILVTLSEAPGRALRMSSLAETTNFSQSRLSHAVSRLEDAGWVRRAKCSTDGRGQFAVLTDMGYEVVAAAVPGHDTVMREQLLDLLRPEQIEQLNEICQAALTRETR